MSDTMKVQPFGVLLAWILKEYEENRSIFGIHRSQFYVPRKDAPYSVPQLFGSRLGTPIGPAAGPHTQLTQNIIAAWLCGARFIELKTVQIMDELEIPRPCIDLADEGYNVEWSQELRLKESAGEYIKAWALIHILNRLLGWEELAPLGTIFNMSVGYNLEGIQSPPMTQFMQRLEDASEEIALIRDYLRKEHPQFADIEIPARLTNNVTLSTMHGCPPDEIERIARYLLAERRLHTTVKLNPTLLGKDRVLEILHRHLGFEEIVIPDKVFEHDLRYDRALELIGSLQRTAAESGLSFGVKLSNTLAMANHRRVLPGDEMYMSGRALYPITMNLFRQLAREFDGRLNVSYSAGADALNAATILSCGALPVTAASDLLKPGGYARLTQYLENIEAEMTARRAASLEELAKDKLTNLENAAQDALTNPRYKKSYHPYGLPKARSALDLFDCIAAPCMEPCAVHQNIPEYAWLISRGEFDRALEVILARNPLPGVTGYVCTHLCQTRCTRNQYEEPVAIRALKRFALERGHASLTVRKPRRGRRVAVIGSGPSGLAAAAFLALQGVDVVVFEAKERPGGMLNMIPAFRLPQEVIDEDIERIRGLGVELRLSQPQRTPPEELLRQGFDAVYIAAGFQKDAPLAIEGGEGGGVYAALDLLERVRRGEKPALGRQVAVIGGGDTAMDAARVARRLGADAVTIVYRRSRAEMPASPEEVQGALEEGVEIMELVTPLRVLREKGRALALECLRNRLGEPDASGRPRPVAIEDSQFNLPVDAVITAIGQQPDLDFLQGSAVARLPNGAIAVQEATRSAGVEGVFAGGDVAEGPESIIAACADGRKAAEGICAMLGIPFEEYAPQMPRLDEEEIAQVKRARARRVLSRRPAELESSLRVDFSLVEAALAEDAARAEAARCLQCSAFCDKCVEVCPNRANFTYYVPPVEWTLPRLTARRGRLEFSGEAERFTLRQTRQILHVDDFCNECGNCATFCVHNGKPFAEKPRLFLQEADFALEQDNAYWIGRHDGGWEIRQRRGGAEARLTLKGEAAVYEDDEMRVALHANTFEVQETALKRPFEGERSLRDAAVMLVILRGLTQSAKYLLLL